MLKNWPISWYIILGLIIWGLPGIFVIGPKALALTILALLPLVALGWHDRERRNLAEMVAGEAPPFSDTIGYLMMGATALYLIYDSTLGHRLFEQNMFLNSNAFELSVDSSSDQAGKGRGFSELLSNFFQFMPFILADVARRVRSSLRVGILLAAGLTIFYNAGVGRGPLMIAVFSLLVGSGRLSLSKLLICGVVALGVFELASMARGDISRASYDSPVLDSLVAPYVNLALFNDAACGQGNAIMILVEFLKKFMPGFIIDKSVFQFNISMTLCIYPSPDDSYSASSVFTFLGELIYYKPDWLAALVAGSILAVMARIVESVLNTNHLGAARVYTGLMAAQIPRSSIIDMYSFLLFLIIIGGALAVLPMIDRLAADKRAKSGSAEKALGLPS